MQLPAVLVHNETDRQVTALNIREITLTAVLSENIIPCLLYSEFCGQGKNPVQGQLLHFLVNKGQQRQRYKETEIQRER